MKSSRWASPEPDSDRKAVEPLQKPALAAGSLAGTN